MRAQLKPLLAVLLAGAAICSAQAQTPSPSQTVDSLIQQNMSTSGTTGAAVALLQGNKVLYSRAYGSTASKNGSAVDGKTVFAIGPVSTALSGFAAMQLVEQGKLKLDVPASSYLKDLPKPWKAITVRQFLTHSSGIPQLRAGEKATWDEVLDEGEVKPLEFTPGTGRKFSAVNYEVVGKIIEQVSGESYEKYMGEHVFPELGMQRSGTKAPTSNAATGFEERGTVAKPVSPHFMDYQAPATGLFASLDDMVAWEQTMFAAKLLSKSGYQQMFRPSGSPAIAGKEEFDIGWETRRPAGDLIVSRVGGTRGFSTAVIIDLVRGDALILMRNSQGGKGDIGPLSKQLFETVFGLPRVVAPRRQHPRRRIYF